MTSNSIASHEIRIYRRSMPLWIQRADTIGIVAAALAISVTLILSWLQERASLVPSYTYQFLLSFKPLEIIQIGVGIVYAGVLIRGIAVGVSIANRYRPGRRDDILLTGITGTRLIIGQWQAGLFQMRGWMLALGLVRIAATVVLLAEFQFNLYWNHIYGMISCCGAISAFDYGFPAWQIPLAFVFCIVLGLFEVWATVGVGILAATWIRQPTVAFVAALAVRILPIFIFLWFPLIDAALPNNALVLRWYEYTWFAFVDGGTSAMFRLTFPAYLAYSGRNYNSTHSVIAFFAALHMFLLYGISSYTLARWRWRRLGASSIRSIRQTLSASTKSIRFERIETLTVLIITFAVILAMIAAWLGGSHVVPTPGTAFAYNDVLMAMLQVALWLAIALATVRAMIAGVNSVRQVSDKPLQPRLSAREALFQCLTLCHRLRAWFFGLSVILMLAFAMLITEHLITSYNSLFSTCMTTMFCNYPMISWQPSQWIFGLAMAVVLSGLILFSSVLLGRGVATVVRSRRLALAISVALRAVPVLLALLLHDRTSPGYFDSILFIRWHYDFLLIPADTGISAMIGMAEPIWHTGHAYGLTNIGYSVLAFLLVAYLLLAYCLAGIALIRFAASRYPTVPLSS